MNNSRLNQTQNWLDLATEASWSVANLAKRSGVSVRALERYFLENTGKPPKVWLTEQRQKKALALLRDSFSVKETAIRLGYRYTNNFSRDFKMHWGCCPSELIQVQAYPEHSKLNQLMAAARMQVQQKA